jgi:hypothetical protein
MRDVLLQCSGVIAIAAALIHGWLGEARVFPRVTIEPPRIRTLMRVVWQASTVAWVGCGALLIVAPWMASDPARHWIVVTMAVVFALGAFGNARPAFRLAGDECRRSPGCGGILASPTAKSTPLERALARRAGLRIGYTRGLSNQKSKRTRGINDENPSTTTLDHLAVA